MLSLRHPGLGRWFFAGVLFSKGQEESIAPHPEGFDGIPFESEGFQKADSFLRENAPSSILPLGAAPVCQRIRGDCTLSHRGPKRRMFFPERFQDMLLDAVHETSDVRHGQGTAGSMGLMGGFAGRRELGVWRGLDHTPMESGRVNSVHVGLGRRFAKNVSYSRAPCFLVI